MEIAELEHALKSIINASRKSRMFDNSEDYRLEILTNGLLSKKQHELCMEYLVLNKYLSLTHTKDMILPENRNEKKNENYYVITPLGIDIDDKTKSFVSLQNLLVQVNKTT